MKPGSLFLASIVVGAVGASMMSVSRADDSAAAPSRADVKAAVMSARTSGQLRPAGETAEYQTVPPRGFERSRAQLRAEVLEAQANGELIPAGEAVTPFAKPSVSILARAQVKEEVRLAQRQGELIPSGQGFGPVETVARAPRRATFAFSTSH